MAHRAQAIVAVGTAGLRTAGNRDEVVAAIEAATGVTVAPSRARRRAGWRTSPSVPTSVG